MMLPCAAMADTHTAASVTYAAVKAAYDAAAAGDHRGNQRILFEQRKCLRPDQVDAVCSQACRFAAFALQFELGTLKNPQAHPLFDAPLAGFRPGG